MHDKIKSLQEIQAILEKDREEGLQVVQCHGVFDLLHPGHIRHFKQAKNQGDKLVVTVTPDRFVNKGPGRPAFNEELRLETIAALACVDYVVLNETPDAVTPIRQIKPNIYVKGMEYSDHAADVTGKIAEEVHAVEETGGRVCYTDDLVFSSSTLLNRYFSSEPPEVTEFLRHVKQLYTAEDLLKKIEDLSDLKVLVVGDAIIDEYQYVQPLGQSGKGLHMAARCLDKEVFLGGSLIIANHLAQFADNVTLLTSIGEQCPHRHFIQEMLDPNVTSEFLYVKEASTLTKRRYVLKDGKTLSKLFETYSTNDQLLSDTQTERVVNYLQSYAKDYDLVLACDFGNGFSNPAIVTALSQVPTFLAVNTQINSGNRGFHVVTHYKRADFISLNEPELRLAAHDRYTPLEGLMLEIAQKLQASSISVTRGVNGALCWSQGEAFQKVPALTTNAVDRVGAGDSYLSLASLCLAKGYPTLLASFIGSIAAAMDVQIIGNKEAVHKAPLCKYLTRLLK